MDSCPHTRLQPDPVEKNPLFKRCLDCGATIITEEGGSCRHSNAALLRQEQATTACGRITWRNLFHCPDCGMDAYL